MEEQGEHVDVKLQEYEILNEEFEHKNVEDPSQGFVDWDSLPTYDDDVNDVDPIEESLATDLEEEYKEYELHPKFGDLYPNKDDQLEDEELTDDIADYEEGIAIFHEAEALLEEVNLSDSFTIFDDNSTYHVLDKSPEDKAFDLSVTPISYVDFIEVDAFLSNSSNQICDEIYMVEGNVLSKGDGIVTSYLRIFMAYGEDKALEKNDKFVVLSSGIWGFHDKHRGMLMMKSITFIMGCSLVVILRRGEWNELTGHPKDCGKNRPNLWMNSF